MTLEELAAKMDAGFAAVDKKMDEGFAAVGQTMDDRFAFFDKKTDARFTAVDKKMDERFAAVDKKMDERFAAVDKKMDEGFKDSKIRDEELRDLAKFGLEANDILREDMNRRFDTADQKNDEQIGLLKAAIRHPTSH